VYPVCRANLIRTRIGIFADRYHFYSVEVIPRIDA
jgi:hypothetical protein